MQIRSKPRMSLPGKVKRRFRNTPGHSHYYTTATDHCKPFLKDDRVCQALADRINKSAQKAQNLSEAIDNATPTGESVRYEPEGCILEIVNDYGGLKVKGPNEAPSWNRPSTTAGPRQATDVSGVILCGTCSDPCVEWSDVARNECRRKRNDAGRSQCK